jgi:myo-inositol-1-phosphate synthase
VIIDAACDQIAKDRGLGGPVIAASSPFLSAWPMMWPTA